MKIRPLRALLVTLMSLSVWMLPSFAPPAEAAAAITLANPEHPCEGEAATLTWDPPADGAGLTGYEVTHMIATGGSTPRSTVTGVDASTTRLAFTLSFGTNTFLIRAVTASGTAGDPFATAGILGNRVPAAMSFNLGSGSVGDHAAMVPFQWYGSTPFVTGGGLPVTVTVTGNGPSGAVGPVGIGPISNPAPPNRVVASFTKLKNGTPYTFDAVTSNACGSSPASRSPIFVPGAPSAWVDASPPLTAPENRTYRYTFTASGTPVPTFQLLNGPDWLTLGAHGYLVGRPPSGTTSFSYSVKAANGVGVWTAGVSPSDIVAGPFTVSVAP